MNKIRKIVKSFLKKYDLDKSDLTYLVAFSGGFDSMCLLDVLKKCTQNKIIALHLNHKWRGEESDLEEKNCKNFCNTIGVEFYSESLNPEVPHTETAARNARYEFFEKCSNKFNTKIIFTAHNKNDQAETLFYRIATGTGVSGLRAINEHRDIFYRPILEISRDEIEQYIQENNLTPNLDSSNSDTKYKRNLIRAEILPKFQKINPDAINKINSLAQIATEETEIIDEYLNSILAKISDCEKIRTQKFLKLSENVQKRLIYNIFIRNNLEYDRKKILNILNFVKENALSKSGKTCSLTSNLWLFTNSQYIETITDNKQNLPYFHITKEGKYENNDWVFEIEKFEKEVRKFPNDNENIAYVDLQHFTFDFEFRTRQDGDIIKPFGLNGTQKLKKYLNEKKIPNHEKENLLFLTQYNEILWAVNLGISDKIKVITKPTHRLTFYKKGQK